MRLLSVFFPVLVVFATLALVVFAIRLDHRLSRGSQSPGPREVIRPKQVGLRQTPWELQALDDQVRATSSHRARHDLAQTVNRLTKAAGIDDPAYLLTPDANDYMIAGVIEVLEQRLELPQALPQAFPQTPSQTPSQTLPATPESVPVPAPGFPAQEPQQFAPPDRLGSPDR